MLLSFVVVSLLAASSAPTPLYATYAAAWHFSPVTTTVVFGVSTLVEQGAGLVRVVAGVQVHGDVVRQKSQVVQTIQSRGEERGVVTVGSGQHAAQRNSVTIRHA